MLILVLLGWVPLALFGGFSYQQAKNALEKKEMDQLIAIRDLKVREIEAYFQQMEGQVRTLSRSPLVVDALQRLPQVFHQLGGGVKHDDPQQHASSSVKAGFEDELDFGLRQFYRDQVLKRLQQSHVAIPSLEEIFPYDHAAHRAQSLYLQHNPFELGEREWLDDAGDESGYSALHRQIHPILRGYRQEFGYYDLFLVDVTGNLLYSVVKEVDFGTSLAVGPYRDTSLGRAWKAAMVEEDGDAVVVTELERYLPSQFQPAGFLGSPVFDHQGEQRLGVLLFQFPLDRINTIVQDRQGMEESSEVVLGMRVGDSLTFLNELLFSDEHSLEKEIPLGEQKALPMQFALRGGVDSGRSMDYQQNDVLAAWAPVTRLGWGLVAKINREQALQETVELLQRILFSLALLTLAIVLVAWRGADSIVNPIDRLSRRFERVREGDFAVRAPVTRQDELGKLAAAFNQMTEGLYTTTTSLESLNEILASMGEGVLVLSASGEIEHCNPAFSKLSGLTAEEIEGQSIKQFFGEIGEEVFRDRELLMKTVDRGQVAVLLSRSLLMTSSLQLHRSVLVCRDLTERKRMEQQEQHAAFQAGVAEMSASILHNIGNTVTGATSQVIKLRGHKKGLDILGDALQQGEARASSLLQQQQEGADPELWQGELEWMQKVFASTSRVADELAGEKGIAGVESKLDKSISHISEIISLQQNATRGGTHITQFELQQTIEDAAEMTHDNLERYGIAFSLQMDAQLQHVTLPRNPFIQMVLNLLKNSVESIQQRQQQHKEPPGTIEVAVKLQQDQRFEMTVQDNGVGISDEVAGSLFTFGYTTKPTGSGFGLHASANFVKSLEGDIAARNVEEGMGAIFLVTLPLRVEKKD